VQRAQHSGPWIYVVRADGQGKRPLVAGHDATWSPDGKRLAFVHDHRLITIGRDGRGRKRISPKGEYVVTAIWSPRGRTIAYVARTTGNPRIETVRADGTHVHVLARRMNVWGRPVWTPDGKRILVSLEPT
jgi:Tol biopolymer transport system component